MVSRPALDDEVAQLRSSRQVDRARTNLEQPIFVTQASSPGCRFSIFSLIAGTRNSVCGALRVEAHMDGVGTTKRRTSTRIVFTGKLAPAPLSALSELTSVLTLARV